MPTTAFLAQLIGLTLTVTAVAALCQPKVIIEVVKQLVKDRALLFILGVIDVAVALVIILTHNVWSGDALTVIVTLIGWGLLIRGFLRLVLSDAALKAIMKIVNIEKTYYWIITLLFLCGIALTLAGMMYVPA